MKLETQKLIENMYNKNQTMPLLKSKFSASNDINILIKSSGLDYDFCLDLLCQMALHKRATVSTLIGILAHHGELQDVANSIYIACEQDLLDYSPVTEQFIVKWVVEQEVYDLINNYHFLPPMIVPPLEVTSNTGSGMLTMQTDSLILKDNHHEDDICLDVINIKNSVSLTINTDVVKSIRNTWKNLNKKKPSETFEEFQKRQAAFALFEKHTMRDMALLVNEGNEFYFSHKVDKRGRSYCKGYTINYQGNDYQKSVIELKQTQLIQGF